MSAQTTLQTLLATLTRISPALAAQAAGTLFRRPPRQRTRDDEERFIRTGRSLKLPYGDTALCGWEWGAGPTVVLAHGWGSRAGRWATLAPALVESGHRVVAYDAPAHGRSPGLGASLPEFARALSGVTKATGPVFAAVGHSLGGAAIALAASWGLELERAVLIAAPADPASYEARFAEYLQMPPTVRELMSQDLQRQLGITWAELDIPKVVRGLSIPALIIHDVDDADVAANSGEAIAGGWPGAELMCTSGLGHRSIIRDPEVVSAVIQFIGN
ncbi:MAG: alpha/beta fold hydrolase [Gemmatimonadota bacterium]